MWSECWCVIQSEIDRSSVEVGAELVEQMLVADAAHSPPHPGRFGESPVSTSTCLPSGRSTSAASAWPTS